MSQESSLQASVQSPIRPGIEEVSFTASHDGSRQTYLRKDFRSASQAPAPLLVLYLHGALSHQQQGMTAEIYGDAFSRLARELESREAVYICPEYRGNSWMSAAAESDLLDILRSAQDRYRPQKTILMGGSMGGTSTLIFATKHADLLDGAFALCPATDVAEMYPRFPDHFVEAYGGSPEEIPAEFRARSSRYHAQKLTQLPLSIVHGTHDETIPIHHARLLVEQLRPQHQRLYYTELENGNHDAPVHIEFREHFEFLLDE
jgi:dipeptidyl aminopeptidase/acylaminoacyl peptidase